MVTTVSHDRDAPDMDPTPGGGGGSRIVRYRYDAWNRLVAIDHEEEESAHPIAVYRYNALHQRVLMRVDQNPGDSTHTLNQQRVLYYSPMWQVLEERIDDNWSAESSAVDRHVQHVWGTLHLDDIILHREDNTLDGNYDDDSDGAWYHLTDPQCSTVAILDLAAAVVERVSYDVWGQPRHHPGCDFDGDGDFDKSDADALDALILSGPVLITDAGYRPEMDLDRDGDVDAFDQALRGTTYIAALPRGALSSTGVGGVDNTVGWSGYRYDQPVRLYSVRFRFYDPVMFRWLNRDPAGYVDSMNLYGYGWGNPVGWFDPFGLGKYGDDDDRDVRELLNDPFLREHYFDPANEGARWGEPLMEGFGYGLLVPAMILIPGPEDLILAAAIVGVAKVGGVLYDVVKTSKGLRLVRAGVLRAARPLSGPSIRVFGGKAALAIGAVIDAIATVEFRRLVRTNGFSVGWPNFRFDWHRLPKDPRTPKWAQNRNLPHWHRRGPGGIGRHRPWDNRMRDCSWRDRF